MPNIKLFILLILITFLAAKPTISSTLNEVNWHEVTSTIHGRQWINVNSMRKLGQNQISIESTYLPTDKKEFIYYTMAINCEDRQYKDLDVDGKTINNPRWSYSNGDILINQVIDQSCNLLNS